MACRPNRSGQMAEDLPPIVDLRQSATALRVQRGVMRMLRERHDMACYAEVPLSNGRRADILAVGPKGEIWIIEIKSSPEDFYADHKWPFYVEYCDRLYFAIPPFMDPAIIPHAAGLIVADGFGGEIIRDAGCHPLVAARRKAVTLRFARAAAFRLHGLADPQGVSGAQ
jgi:hypothetical protein